MCHRMTGELRESLAKLAKAHAEKAKVGVRKAKQKGVTDLKKTKSSVSEDTVHRLEKYVCLELEVRAMWRNCDLRVCMCVQLQQIADNHITSIEDMLAAKSAELTKPN